METELTEHRTGTEHRTWAPERRRTELGAPAARLYLTNNERQRACQRVREKQINREIKLEPEGAGEGVGRRVIKHCKSAGSRLSITWAPSALVSEHAQQV